MGFCATLPRQSWLINANRLSRIGRIRVNVEGPQYFDTTSSGTAPWFLYWPVLLAKTTLGHDCIKLELKQSTGLAGQIRPGGSWVLRSGQLTNCDLEVRCVSRKTTNNSHYHLSLTEDQSLLQCPPRKFWCIRRFGVGSP